MACSVEGGVRCVNLVVGHLDDFLFLALRIDVY